MARRGLSRQAVVEAALRLADERGTTALSMRALSRELGVDPMAVYRHVADKADLLGAMCDATVAQITPPDPAGPWEPQVRRMVAELRAVLLARPSLVPVLLGAPATPAATALAARAIALLARAGLPEEQAAGLFGAVFAYTLGAVAVEIAEPPPATDEDRLRRETAALAGTDHLDAAVELMQAPAFTDAGLDVMLLGVRALLGE